MNQAAGLKGYRTQRLGIAIAGTLEQDAIDMVACTRNTIEQDAIDLMANTSTTIKQHAIDMMACARTLEQYAIDMVASTCTTLEQDAKDATAMVVNTRNTPEQYAICEFLPGGTEHKERLRNRMEMHLSTWCLAHRWKP